MGTPSKLDARSVTDLYQGGLTAVDIARRMGSSPSSIGRLLRRHNVPVVRKYTTKYKLSPEQCGAIRDRYLHGESVKTLATALSMHDDTIRRALVRLSVPIRGSAEQHRYNGRGGVGDISGSYISNLQRGASLRGISWDVSKQFLWDLYNGQEGRCALSGIAIGFKKPQTASLDRKDSANGYSETNVQWVHKSINTMKWDFSEFEFVLHCILVAQHHAKKLSLPNLCQIH